MKLKIFSIVLYIIRTYFTYYIDPKNIKNEITSFAFGSCFGSFNAKRLDSFKIISQKNPDFFVWTGDLAYLDTQYQSIINTFYANQYYNKEEAQLKFNSTFYNEYYSIFRKNKPVYGVWDDHDYGQNDGNYNFKFKDEIKQLYLDVLEEPLNSTRRNLNQSIDASYSFGNGYKSFKLILLDARYNKRGYLDDDTRILSENQWIWLENELKSEETFTFIVSGIQILPFNRFLTESWYSKDREKLFNLIGKLSKSGVVLISGDVHFGQMYKTFCVHPSKFSSITF
jgi:alkaline phosphatase D